MTPHGRYVDGHVQLTKLRDTRVVFIVSLPNKHNISVSKHQSPTLFTCVFPNVGLANGLTSIKRGFTHVETTIFGHLCRNVRIRLIELVRIPGCVPSSYKYFPDKIDYV